jgi:CubicO group peptidase (beta-lactamase class C family)
MLSKMLRGCVFFAVVLSPASLLANPALNDRVALEAFVDGVIESQMEEKHVAGVTVAIVFEDDLILAKGYGYADVENRIPVDPHKTLFQIQSVTKLFTWTALMQLYEQGKVDLDTDVNQYLKTLKIPDTFPQPITIRHLMAHTSGLAELIVIGTNRKDADSMLPLREVLAKDFPDRIRPPGEISSYSNHGTKLAGLIIEEVSGLTWEDYVRKNIMDPLQMINATPYQPVPESIISHMSKGYKWEAGKFKDAGFFQSGSPSPAGSIKASAVAMAQFMRAHLNQGQLGEAKILEQATAVKMHSKLFGPYKGLKSMLHGFIEYSRNGLFMLGHGGDGNNFHSDLVLVPDAKLGLFISTNSESGTQVCGALTKAFFDRYFPHEDELVPLENGSDLSQFVGHYALYRHTQSSLVKLNRLNLTASVTANKDNQLVVRSMTGDPSYWVEVAPKLFQNIDDGNKLTFDKDENGTPRMFIGSVLASGYKLSGMDSPVFQNTVLAFSLLIFLYALIAWPIQRFSCTITMSKSLKRSRMIGWSLSFCTFITLIGFVSTISESVVYDGYSFGVKFFLYFAYFIVLLTIVHLLFLWPLLRDKSPGKMVKAYHMSLSLAGVGMCWILNYWNLMGI